MALIFSSLKDNIFPINLLFNNTLLEYSQKSYSLPLPGSEGSLSFIFTWLSSPKAIQTDYINKSRVA